MATIFEAKFLYTQVDEEVMVFGMVDDEFETKKYLLMSRSLNSDEQDAEWGLDGVYIEYCDQGASTYGGIEQIVLKSNGIDIRVNSDTACELGTQELIEVVLSNTGYIPESIEEFLKKLFEGKSDIVIRKE